MQKIRNKQVFEFKYKIRPISVIKIKSRGFSARNQGSARKNQGWQVVFSKAEGLFNKKTTQRGTRCSQPSDHGSAAEIRSERERARGHADER
jgi:hypothetical protein